MINIRSLFKNVLVRVVAAFRVLFTNAPCIVAPSIAIGDADTAVSISGRFGYVRRLDVVYGRATHTGLGIVRGKHCIIDGGCFRYVGNDGGGVGLCV